MRRFRGFSLLELLVVILILAILAALAMPSFAKVLNESEDSSTQVTLESTLRQALALAALESRPPSLEDVKSSVDDLPEGTYRLSAQASADPFWLSMAADEDALGLAVASPAGCVMARTEGSKAHSWKEEPLGANCSGIVALLGPGASSFTPLPELDLHPVSNLSALSRNRALLLSWDPVPDADHYEVKTEGRSVLSDEAELFLDQLPVGSTLEVLVTPLGTHGERGTSSSITGVTRPDGLHDAEFVWRSNDDTLCFGGASSWSWKAYASGAQEDSGRFRIEVRTLNEVGKGVSPWMNSTFMTSAPGRLQAGEMDLCAPEGESGPPFDSVRIIETRTGAPAPLGQTGSPELGPQQILEVPRTEALNPLSLED